jgi:HemY protein
MTRIILLFLLIAAAVCLAVWLADHPGRVEIEMMGYEVYTEQVGLLIGVVVIFAAIVAVLYRIWRSLLRAPQRIIQHRGASKRQRGYQALTQGMVAVAAGDSREAKRFARRADTLLKDPPLTMLLSAQAAQLDGDEDAARRYFKSMLEDSKMAFLGVRGLLMQAMRNGDQPEALRLVRRAQALRPNTPWVLKYLLKLQVKEGLWKAADITLQQVIKLGTVDAAAGRRQRATLAIEMARETAAAGEPAAAVKHARRAYDLDPGLVPATVALVKSLTTMGKARRAAKVIESAWTLEPHPALAAAYDECGGDGEAPLARVNRFQRLHDLRPDHAESHLALAEASLAAQLWGQARRLLEPEGTAQCSVRVLRLLANLEEQEYGDLQAARRWLEEAVTPQTEQAWYCDSCGSIAGDWAASCASCGAFASLSWRAPLGQMDEPGKALSEKAL